MFNSVIIFNLSSLFFSYIDEVLHKCCSFKGKAIIVFHHYLSMFLLFSGTFFGYNKVCIFTVLTVLITWLIFGDCIISQWVNKSFGLPIDTEFQSITYHFRKMICKLTDIELNNWIIDIFVLGILILYNIYIIYQNRSITIDNVNKTNIILEELDSNASKKTKEDE